ncbi:MAG: hypothetical protein DMF75_14080 [Acidobacteria bacterium]|nr:MAG: hypothetical protein DMF75_14080 [Acidobacteriota bacterium]
MAYQDEHGERRRIVVETPNERREVIHSEQVRHPQSSGVSGATLAAVVIAVIALAAVMILFVLNRQDTMNNNATAQQPPQTIIQEPAQQPVQQQPPIVVQQPAPATQPAPVIVNNPPPAGGSTSGRVSDDSTIQTAIDKKLGDNPGLASLGITAVVLNGKVTLTGVVKTESQKAQVERTVRSVKGVKSIDNQISVGY